MGHSYMFEYINENEFKKLERAVKKYNMLAYKKLYFEYYPALKEGHFLGNVVNDDSSNPQYELILPTDTLFTKVHGIMKLHYMVDLEKKVVKLDKLTPYEILSEGHQSELVAYKGIMVSKQNSDKDMFKINLLNMLNK